MKINTKLQTLMCFMFQPLVERLKIREGGLIFFNITLSIFFYKNGYMVLMQAALAVLCMSALYGFNDYADRAADLINPKKIYYNFFKNTIKKKEFSYGYSILKISKIINKILSGFKELSII